MVSKRRGLAGVKAKRDRVEAPSQHAWGLVGLHSHFCAGIEGQLCGFGLPWLSQSPVVLVLAKADLPARSLSLLAEGGLKEIATYPDSS